MQSKHGLMKSREGEIVKVEYNKNGEIFKGKIESGKISCLADGCRGKYSSENSFYVHCRKHKKDGHKCNICGHPVVSPAQLVAHMKRHGRSQKEQESATSTLP